MVLLAKRVREKLVDKKMISTSGAEEYFFTCVENLLRSILIQHWLSLLRVSAVGYSVAFVSSANLHIPESRRRRSMPRAHGLHGLAFAAVGRAPQGPLVARADSVH